MTPVCSPMPMLMGAVVVLAAFRAWTAAAISSAAVTARWACSVVSTGAPQKAMTQSPMYLSMVPRWARMVWVRRLNTRLSRAWSWVGSMCSDISVNPRMSLNMTVSSWLRACML